jgi:hypothetical protein
VDVNALLDKDIDAAPFNSEPGAVYLFLPARPVSNRRYFLEASLGDHENIKDSLTQIVGRASKTQRATF